MDLDLDLESLARDLDLSDLRYHLAQDSSGDEDEDSDLESPFPTATQVEVEETVVDLPPVQVRTQVEVEETVVDLTLEQVRRVVDLRDYRLSADIDIENPNNTLTPYNVQNKYL